MGGCCGEFWREAQQPEGKLSVQRGQRHPCFVRRLLARVPSHIVSGNIISWLHLLRCCFVGCCGPREQCWQCAQCHAGKAGQCEPCRGLFLTAFRLTCVPAHEFDTHGVGIDIVPLEYLQKICRFFGSSYKHESCDAGAASEFALCSFAMLSGSAEPKCKKKSLKNVNEQDLSAPATAPLRHAAAKVRDLGGTCQLQHLW